ncbi:MAG: NAD-dependent succinate-semialdehyde dehydrogenase [Neisseriaceae bacterium]
MQLNNQLLLKNQCLVDGQWIDNSLDRIEVLNPATGELVEKVPRLTEQQILLAINAASRALEEWRYCSAQDKSQLLKKWHDLIIANELDLAQIMSNEQGKPLEEAVGEIRYGASYIEWFLEEAKRIEGEIISHANGHKTFITKEPIGVCALITPWNFPNAMLARKMAPALAAGCTVVIKPSEQTPLSALALVELATIAGFPRGVINIITGDSEKIGGLLTSNPLIRKLSFTGSVRVGETLKSQCIATHKSTSMELGGNAPFIVFEDAKLEATIDGLLHAKFRNTGQTCVAANRILVQKRLYPTLVEALKVKISQLVIGDPYQQDVKLGPLINKEAVNRIEEWVQEAISQGAELIVGGRKPELGPCFYGATLLTGVTPKMRLFQEEIFGPVLALTPFETEEEALQLANQTEAGLAAYLFTSNLTRIAKLTERLRFGMIGVNTGIISYASIPFGGTKYSGEGREGSRYGINEYLEIKCTTISAD